MKKDCTKPCFSNGIDFDNINENAKRFRLSVERDAYIEGLRHGFQLASDRYLEYLSEFEKRRANSVIVISNSQQPPT